MFSQISSRIGSQVRLPVLLAPMMVLLSGVLASLTDPVGFLASVTAANNWILKYFSIGFNLGSFAFVLTLVWVWFSPLGKVRIGGADAIPILAKWNWFAVTLCTTIAIGILFWATAEPLYHFHEPPGLGDIEPASDAARRFAMSSLFMHWSITPYAIYTVPSLAFALAYYNLNKSYSLSGPISVVFSGIENNRTKDIIDAVALFSLVAGISASLGVGILSISSGLAPYLGVSAKGFLLAFVAFSIVAAFMISSISGLMHGIRILSDWNVRFFFVLCAFLIVVGPTGDIFAFGLQGLGDYAVEFLPRSVGAGTTADKVWSSSWTTFYWANWLAWAPVTAMFLGRIARGYTVRQFILFNLILPSSFAVVWMSIFGASAIGIDQPSGELYAVLQSQGPEAVIYQLFANLPLSAFWSIGFVLLSFICFVTAADSNTEAIASICSKSDDHPTIEQEEHRPATFRLKVLWASLIGFTSWVMVTFSGVDGVRMLSNLGGLPALFIVLAMNAALIRMGTKHIQRIGG